MDRRPIFQFQVAYAGKPVTVVDVFTPIADCQHPISVPCLAEPHSSFEVGCQVGRLLSGEEADAGWSFAILSEG